MSPPGPSRRELALLVLVVALGVALRAPRLFHAGLHGDEAFHLLDRAAVLRHGVPVWPSGVVRPYGGPFTWFGALGTWAGGFGVLANRLPFLLLGSAVPWLCWRPARRLAGPVAGLVAAAVAALHPGLIEWSAHVGVYGAITFAVALAVDRWCVWVFETDDRAAAGCALWLCVAALCHPCVVFLFPGLLLGGIAVRGWGWATERRTLAVAATVTLAAVVFFAVMWFGDPSMREHLVARSRAGTSAGYAVAARGWRIVRALGPGHGVASPWNAVPYGLALLGAFAGLREWRARGWTSLRATASGRAAVLVGAWTATVVGLVAISRYQNPRYLLPALPLLAVGAGLGVAALARVRAFTRLPVWVAVPVLLVTHLAVSRPAVPAITDDHAEAARVLGALADGARPDDVCLGGTAEALVCVGAGVRVENIYSSDFGTSSFVRRGRRFDRITGRPVVGTPDAVRPILDAAPRCWYLVSAKERRLGRVSDDLHVWLTARMTLVTRGGGLSLYVTAP